MRNPGRSDGDDARAGSIDPTAPQARSEGGPADDDLAGMPASEAPRTTGPHRAEHVSPPGNDDLDGDLTDDFDVDLDAGPDIDDDLLFDPLLSDEPIDLAAVRADDALIDALSGGALAGADDLADDDPLVAMLAAWAASARPEPATDGTLGVETADGDPDVPTPSTGPPGGEPSEDGDPDAGSVDQEETDGLADRHPDLDPPTVRLIGPRRHTAEDRPATPSTVPPSIAARLPAEHGMLGGPGGAPRGVAPAAASGVALLSRIRTAGRRTRPSGQPLPPGHPLRRAAVAVVVVALGVSGAAASGGTAQPGDPAWAITKVFFADRAESIMAAQVVSAGLERAQILLSQRQPDQARQVLAEISASLMSVREEEGHARLRDQQQMLESVAALTPPLPGNPNLTSATTPDHKTDPGSSVLAQGAPSTAQRSKAGPPTAAPPVAAKPADPKTADPKTGSTGAAAGTTTGGTGTGGTATGSGETGTTGSSGGTATDSSSGSATGSSSGGTGTGSSTTGGSATGNSTTSGTATGNSTTSGTATDSSTTGGSATGNSGPGTSVGESGTGPTATDPAGTGSGPAVAGATGNDPALGGGAGTGATPADGAQPVLPGPAAALDSTGTSATPTPATPTPEPVTPPTKEPESNTPAPPPAVEPAPLTPEQSPAEATAPVDGQADGNTANPPADTADTPTAAGSAPAVPADAAGPVETGGAVVPSPTRTAVTTVVPEPVNVAPATTTHETSDKPTRDTAADRADSADTPTRTTSADDTPEPVHVDDTGGPGSSASGSDSGSGDGSAAGSNNDNSGSDSHSDDSHSDDNHSDDSRSDGNRSDTGGPGGARTSAAVSIHP